MPMTKPGKFDSKGAWNGLPAEKSGRKRSMSRDFIQKNYTPYDGDASVLWQDRPRATEKLMGNPCTGSCRKERARKGRRSGVWIQIVVSGLTAHGPGYISEDHKDMEQIRCVIRQTSHLKTSIHALWRYPYGRAGLPRLMAMRPSPELHKIFTLNTAELITRVYLVPTLRR